MTQKIKALAKLAALTTRYAEENPLAMHPATAREWEGVIDQATEDAQEAGATDAETDEASDWITDRASHVLQELRQTGSRA